MVSRQSMRQRSVSDEIESWISIARRLNFDSHTNYSVEEENRGSDADCLSDEEMLFESVYGSLLEAIVSKQIESSLAEISSSELDSDGFKTPTSAPQLNGVAETCPGAPMKPTKKLIRDYAENFSFDQDYAKLLIGL